MTTFDVHATLKDILKLSLEKVGKYQSSEDKKSGFNFSEAIPKISPLRGLSLFEKLPSRSCYDAGIPKAYCACSPPTAFTGNMSIIERGAQEIVKTINAKLPMVCERLSVNQITASAIVPEYDMENAGISNYVISITVQPGQFSFEAMVSFNDTSGEFSGVSNILRTNKKIRETDCLKDGEAQFELVCYCQS